MNMLIIIIILVLYIVYLKINIYELKKYIKSLIENKECIYDALIVSEDLRHRTEEELYNYMGLNTSRNKDRLVIIKPGDNLTPEQNKIIDETMKSIRKQEAIESLDIVEEIKDTKLLKL